VIKSPCSLLRYDAGFFSANVTVLNVYNDVFVKKMSPGVHNYFFGISELDVFRIVYVLNIIETGLFSSLVFERLSWMNDHRTRIIILLIFIFVHNF